MYRIAVIGPPGVGKSALCVRLMSGHFVERYEPTIEDTYQGTVSLCDGTDPVVLELYDLAGMVEYGMLWPIGKCAGFVVVVTCTERTTVQACVEKYMPGAWRFAPAHMPYVVAINKMDVCEEAHVVTPDYVIERGLAGCRRDVLCISVRNGAGVREVFAELVTRIDAQRREQAIDNVRQRIGSARASPSDESVGSPRSTASSPSHTPRGCCVI